MIAEDEGAPRVKPMRLQLPGGSRDDRLGILAGTIERLRTFAFSHTDRRRTRSWMVAASSSVYRTGITARIARGCCP